MEAGIPTRESFTLQKMRLTKTGGLDVHYTIADDDNNVNRYHVENVTTPHADLTGVLRDLTPIVAIVFGMNQAQRMTSAESFGATEAQKGEARRWAESYCDCIDVRGVSISGKGESKGVVIHSIYDYTITSRCSLSTPKLNYMTEVLPYGADLLFLLMKLEDEVFAYLFKGKKAQMSIFGEE